MISIRNN